jgi:hypothetical protein
MNMNNFFSVFTYKPWDSLNINLLTEVKLLSLKKIIKTFPVIEPGFFDDLRSNMYKYNHYSWVESIKRIVGPENEDYDIKPWIFIWGMDQDGRMFQFLLQNIIEESKDSQAILVALAPPELAKLFEQHKEGAVLRTLSLLNSPKKMKFLMVLAPKGKSIAEEQQLLQINKQDFERLKFTNTLKHMPNIKGHWFPTFDVKCPNCNGPLTQVYSPKVGLVCQRCGFKRVK